jgi:hypothetical protein
MSAGVVNKVKNIGTASVLVVAENIGRQILAVANKHASQVLYVKFGSAHVTADVTGVQTITFGASLTAGAFKIQWQGNKTVSIDHTACAASDVQTALQSVTGLASVTVTGNATAGYVVTMTSLTGAPVDPAGTLLAVTDNTTGHTATVVETTPAAYADGLPIAAGAQVFLTGDVCPNGDVYLRASGADTRAEVVYG